MAYIIERKDRFYVVAYDGIDPLTGRERRRWHPAGRDRHDAEAMAARIERDAAGAAPLRGGAVQLGEFLTDTSLPVKRRLIRASTANRYTWFVANYINPAIATSRFAACEPTTSTASTTPSARPVGATAPASPPRPCMRSTSSSAPRSILRCDVSSSGATSPRPPTPATGARPAESRGPGPPTSWPRSSSQPAATGSTPPCTSPPLCLYGDVR